MWPHDRMLAATGRAGLEDHEVDAALDEVRGGGEADRSGADDRDRQSPSSASLRTVGGGEVDAGSSSRSFCDSTMTYRYLSMDRYIDGCQYTASVGAMSTIDSAPRDRGRGLLRAADPRAARRRRRPTTSRTSLKALADPARLRLISIVAASEGQEACVCDLTEPVGLGQPTVSHHLKVLVDAGFLTRTKRGTWAYSGSCPARSTRVSRLLVTA